MAKFRDFLKKVAPAQTRSGQSQVGYLISNQAWEDLCITGYTPLDKNPEIIAGCRAIADPITSSSHSTSAHRNAGCSK